MSESMLKALLDMSAIGRIASTPSRTAIGRVRQFKDEELSKCHEPLTMFV
jgi:hypothetical protein